VSGDDPRMWPYGWMDGIASAPLPSSPTTPLPGARGHPFFSHRSTRVQKNRAHLCVGRLLFLFSVAFFWRQVFSERTKKSKALFDSERAAGCVFDSRKNNSRKKCVSSLGVLFSERWGCSRPKSQNLNYDLRPHYAFIIL
jgi:hypothetical protein